MLNSTEQEIATALKTKYWQMKNFLALSLSDLVFNMLIIVVILTFISRINVVLSWVEHEKSFKTSGPELPILVLGLLFYKGFILLYDGTSTFWQRGLLDSCFQNPS